MPSMLPLSSSPLPYSRPIWLDFTSGNCTSSYTIPLKDNENWIPILIGHWLIILLRIESWWINGRPLCEIENWSVYACVAHVWLRGSTNQSMRDLTQVNSCDLTHVGRSDDSNCYYIHREAFDRSMRDSVSESWLMWVQGHSLHLHMFLII